jgi:SAM-dependent methyltransferase
MSSHAHHHHHHHGADTDFEDWAARADDLEREGEIGLPWIEAAIGWLAELRGDRPTEQIVDIGSGPGVLTAALAHRFASATVTAIDRAGALLPRVTARAHRLGVGDRVRVAEGDLDGDLSGLPAADLIVASRVLHHVADQRRTMGALAARLRPGGVLAVVEGGLPARFLPDEGGLGTAGLSARIEAATATAIGRRMTEHHTPGIARPTQDWGLQLAEVGLTPTGTRTFLLDIPAPVPDAVRTLVRSRLSLVTSLAPGTLSAEDEAAVAALLDRKNPLGIALRPDLFLLSAATVHTAAAR